MKRLLLLAALVLVPAVALMVVATRSAADRQLLLTQLVQNQAAGSLQRANTAFTEQLRDIAMEACQQLDSAIRGGIEAPPPSVAARTLTSTHKLIESVHLYSHPWGFTQLLPDTSLPPPELEQALNQHASRPPQEQHPFLKIKIEDTGYCFIRSDKMKGLYAGYAINQDVVPEAFRDVFQQIDQSGLTCYVSYVGRLRYMSGTNALLLVSDNLSTTPEPAPPSPDEVVTESEALASLRLPYPCGNFEAYAFTPLLGAGKTSSSDWETKLYGWGVVILSLILLAATAIFISQAISSARTAQRQTRFVIGVSHDLRTPVTAVRTLAESIYYGHVSSQETERKFLSTIVHECDRLSNLLERVLFFVRQDQHPLKLNRCTVDIVKVVKHELDALQERDGERVHTSLTIAPRTPEIKADPDGLATVVRNLLDNARKYGADDSGHVHISVNVSPASSLWRRGVALSLADTGKGVPREEQRRIFKKYYRAQTPEQGHIGGIGLGLALIRSIVRAHGGTISLTSRHGEGATFRVWIPAGLRLSKK